MPGRITRAVLECFAGQAQLASALIKQGYFSYGVDRIKRKSAMAPVLQMDLSSRTACDLILTWLDQQKVAGVMICVPKHELEQLTAAFVYSVIMGLRCARFSPHLGGIYFFSLLEGSGTVASGAATTPQG